MAWNMNLILNSSDVEKPDELLQLSVYSHGVAAFKTSGKKTEALKRLENLDKVDGEICCSWKNQRIGAVGAYVTGNVTLTSNSDLGSFVENGVRQFKFDECF